MQNSISTIDNTSVMDAMQERIHFLENELVETRLKLACAKSSQDYLSLELVKMKSNENNAHLQQKDGTRSIVAVPTCDPFLRETKKNTKKIPLKRRMPSKPLNPGSCSSAMNLMALAQLGSNGSMLSLHHHNAKKKKSTLNPNSCASGLDLLFGLDGDSMLSMSSVVSSSKLRASQRGINASLSSGQNFALLFGNVRLNSSASMRRNRSSKNNARLCNMMKNQDTKSNAEWDVFE
mmetsp:Transcript_36163/g.77995  ORF Transcript_36163/g.77995 Transcript_36163/m.77995 type:complete len:235 (+) Transcript_36163:288-992(+)